MKLVEVQSTKEFADSFLPDIFFRMAVNRVLDAAPGFELVRCKECFANGCCSIQIDIGMGSEGYCPKGRQDSKENCDKVSRNKI